MLHYCKPLSKGPVEGDTYTLPVSDKPKTVIVTVSDGFNSSSYHIVL
jgi:hypothetical protein